MTRSHPAPTHVLRTMPIFHPPLSRQLWWHWPCILEPCREPETRLTRRQTALAQKEALETAAPRQAAYHSIVQPYVGRATRVPRSPLSTVSLLVSAHCSPKI